MATLEKKTLIGLFGEKAGLKLYNFLSDCCDSPCCPSEKYTITRFEPKSCSHGTTTYNMYVVSNMDLPGVTILNSGRTYPNVSGAFAALGTSQYHFDIKAGVEYQVSNFTLPSLNDSKFVVVDSRGNWSNVVEFKAQFCAP